MVKSSGACRLAATVWPTSTARWMTVPSTGARMKVCARFTWAVSSTACFCPTWASVWTWVASATATAAVRLSMVACCANSCACAVRCWATA